ncbi:diguanylate cyclase : PAS/PAC sensor signal transduction histidine kinase OS=Methylobacterium extorquens (strain ATCC 14718 / DSM 1338 / AM1) GN=MexAM1_META1p1833 PE=4 SV=1: PAS_9: PAS_9: GGDEF [Gemmataceae bacterium]|nr:diguanylate cyclase : PAS/PAC sensor signal transduction histidine kinase OS=Methylobacterium extorquens (strain ATCC 14718 / DSM 1338 / AM1) GN=MexAM1_META1p1833 PE=4 SV=1: PAS_9: PAS_9: GGDEF [Gemmataceae bacterium]VTT99282.1 diguanylate cyclase : PAS/PAC sensor signal transduction histidine kinase OS=Methylobacterium extorquens (strain ATCC 14718 / DSM 1338 / AM1) GN=MexAM1_META1p1833 PE=4 SV=1: PAS_9: PAS_9: GGDEF [Gemmataceae bacterium]
MGIAPNDKSPHRASQEWEERFRLLLAGVREYAIFFTDPHGTITEWHNGPEARARDAEAFVGSHVSKLYAPRDAAAGKPAAELAEARDRGQVAREGWLVHGDGTRFWGEYVTAALWNDRGGLRGYCRVVRDVTERKHAEEALRSVVSHSTDALVTINHRGVIQAFAGAAEKIFGYAAADAVGRNVSVLMPEPWRSEHDGYIQNYLRTGVPRVVGTGREVTGRRKDGSPVPLDFTLTEFTLDGLKFFTGIMRDITERKEAQAQLEVQATQDALTGLWNRGAILKLLGDELDQGHRDGTAVGVALLDIDHFKRINDGHGHLAGDAVLRVLGGELNAVVRRYDRIGRYGGEEFLIVMPGCDEACLRGLCERVRRTVADATVTHDGRRIAVTVSIGAAVAVPAADATPDTFLRAADLALYRAKAGGRNRVELGHVE